MPALGTLAAALGLELQGDPDCEIRALAGLDSATEHWRHGVITLFSVKGFSAAFDVCCPEAKPRQFQRGLIGSTRAKHSGVACS